MFGKAAWSWQTLNMNFNSGMDPIPPHTHRKQDMRLTQLHSGALANGERRGRAHRTGTGEAMKHHNTNGEGWREGGDADLHAGH